MVVSQVKTVSHEVCHSCHPGATAFSSVRNTARWARERTPSSSLFWGASTANQHLRTTATESVSVFWCLHLTCSSHCYIPHSILLSLSLFIFIFISLTIWNPGPDTTRALAVVSSLCPGTRRGARHCGPTGWECHTGRRQNEATAGGTHSCSAQARCGSFGDVQRQLQQALLVDASQPMPLHWTNPGLSKPTERSQQPEVDHSKLAWANTIWNSPSTASTSPMESTHLT